MEFARPNDIRCSNEFRRVRQKDTYRKTVYEAEWSNLISIHEESIEEETAGRSDLRLIKHNPETDEFFIERKKPRWEIFEDKVWQMFYHLRTPIMPLGKTVIEYGNGSNKQVDGLFSDDEYVYIVECKWRQRKVKGQDVEPGNIKDDVLKWRGVWERVTASLGEIEEFKGKKFCFILATTGVRWTKSLLRETEDFARLIDQSGVDEIINLSKMIGPSARTNLMQKLFMHERIPSDLEQFPCIRSTEGGRNTFYFFAKPSEVIDQCYVPRRSPGSSREERLYGLGSSYQRMLKPTKVNQISEYLKDPSTFFPNSVILSCPNVGFTSTDGGNVGYLSLPHQYGSVMVIDGQHRLYGSVRSGEEKALPFCVIEGMSGLQQSELFAQINQSQSSVPKELLWDLWGEGDDILKQADDNDRASIKAAKRYIVSNIWKDLNSSSSHPLSGRIVIPSQTEKSKMCHISYGQICGFLFKNSKVWDYGYLRGKGTWEEALPFAKHRVSAYFKYLHHYLPEEFDRSSGGKGKNRDGWLLSNYSMEPLIALFIHACIFFGGSPKYQDKWMKSNTNKEEGNALEIIKEFTEVLSRALVDERRGFFNVEGERDIVKQGNSASRGAYMKDIIKFIIDEKPLYKGHFAANLDLEDGPEGDYPSPDTKRRVAELESNYCDALYDVLEYRDGDDWYNKLPTDVKQYIEGQVDYKKSQGRKFNKSPDREWLHQTTTGHLIKIMGFKSNMNSWKDFMNVKWDYFESQWSFGFEILRNMDSHNDPYPGEEVKVQTLAAITLLENWLDTAKFENNPPVIHLLGEPKVSILVGESYEDRGVEAIDAEDGDLTSKVVIGGVPKTTKEPGTYIITYDVKDSDGNEADRVTRILEIIDKAC